MLQPQTEPLLLPDDSLVVSNNYETHTGKVFLCVRSKIRDGINYYEMFDEGDLFWMSDPACLHFLNLGAKIIKGD